MTAFRFALTILCVAQSILAIPRPDFGINGAVTGSDKVVAAGTSLRAEFVKTGAKSVTLSAGYNLLTTMDGALTAIGNDFVRVGGDLADQLKLFAVDVAGTVNTVFLNVNSKIQDLETLLATGVTGNMNTITDLVGSDIEDQFRDAFDAMSTTIGTLKSALGVLKTDVGKAKTASGSSATVSAAIIRKNIPTKSVTDVVAQIRLLLSNVPLITYVVNSSLDNLKLADTFIIELEQQGQSVSTDYSVAISAFQSLLTAEGTELSAIITATIGDDVDTLLTDIQTDLDANTGYTGTLQASLTSVNTQLTSSAATISAISGYYQTYGTSVATLIADLNVELGDNLCEAVKSVTEALVRNGPYSDFCFSKFSPDTYVLLELAINTFDMCFERELARLFSLHPITEGFIVQIVYNVEDLADNLDVCLGAGAPVDATCLETIAPYYDTLATQIGTELTLLGRLVEQETVASYNRLGSCIAVALYSAVFETIAVSTGVNSCMLDGPSP